MGIKTIAVKTFNATNFIVVAGTVVFSIYHLTKLAADLVMLGADEITKKFFKND